MAVIHFGSQKERLDYLKGNYEEIKLEKVAENSKDSQKKAGNSKKTAKNSKKEDADGKDTAE